MVWFDGRQKMPIAMSSYPAQYSCGYPLVVWLTEHVRCVIRHMTQTTHADPPSFRYAREDVMKIEGSGSIKTPAGKKAGKARSGEGSSFASVLEDALGTAAAGSTQAAGDIAAVTFAPDLPDASQPSRNKQAYVRKGTALLDLLEDVKLGLLLGAIPEATLLQLQQRMQEELPHTDDPALIALMREIEIRAAVELAKLGK